MNDRLKQKIEIQKTKVEQFIDEMHQLFMQTADENERNNRLDVFDTLLLLATFVDQQSLEDEFQSTLPMGQYDSTLNYMCQQLREINGFCK